MYTGVTGCNMCCTLFKLLINFVILILFVLFAPFFLDIQPKSYRIPLPYAYNDLLKDNDQLDSVEKITLGNFVGPESLAVLKGDMYTGTRDGKIVRTRRNVTEVMATVNPDCDADVVDKTYDLSKCGRPLGIRLDSKGTLFFVDAFHGLFSVKGAPQATSMDQTKLTQHLMTNQIRVGCRMTKFLDDLTIDEKSGSKGGHVIYMSDVSGRWDFNGKIFAEFEPETNGRVLKYDVNAGNLSVVAGGLWTPKGLQLTDQKDAILVCESAKRTITKLHIRGSKMGTSEPFVEFLPGEPENIRRSLSRAETYWVTFSMSRTEGSPSWMDYLSEYPTLRLFLARGVSLFGNAIETLGSVTRYEPLMRDGFKSKYGDVGLMRMLYGGRPLVLEVDNQGMIVTALQGKEDQLGQITQATEVPGSNGERVLLLSSNDNDYVGRVAFQVSNENRRWP